MKMRKIFLIAALLVVVFLAGCGGENQVTVPNKPERIVVTSASFLEPLHAVGGNIVGRPDSKNNMPDWAENIQSIGHVYNVDVEKILACAPDLVVINKGMNEKLLPVLNENKIPALVLDMKTYADVKSELKIFGEITGNIDTADKIIAQLDGEIQQILDSVPHEKKRVAILHSTAQGLSVQLEGSIAGNIVEMFGWENVAAGMTPLENNPDAAPYSMETLAAQNPEIIFVTSMGDIDEIKVNMQRAIETNDAWQAIGAVKNNQLYYLPQNLFLLSPGLNYPAAVRTVAELIYGKVS